MSLMVSRMRSGTELDQFLRIFLPTIVCRIPLKPDLQKDIIMKTTLQGGWILVTYYLILKDTKGQNLKFQEY